MALFWGFSEIPSLLAEPTLQILFPLHWGESEISTQQFYLPSYCFSFRFLEVLPARPARRNIWWPGDWKMLEMR